MCCSAKVNYEAGNARPRSAGKKKVKKSTGKTVIFPTETMKQNSKYLKALLDSTSFICYVCFALQYEAPDNHRHECFKGMKAINKEKHNDSSLLPHSVYM